ncbi:hypothetical protein EPI10_007213 [Gossypium australe]|uniref:Tf2-1-like SH3-like domain-containing protein n=1 Tax=Gossypium australe TaxID=47621 RepID=A0A5B6WWW9_9ROSI|nr:hypothetical protein EPI10_007213 [Gossypium australe]
MVDGVKHLYVDIDYALGDKVLLKISPWKKILCFGCKGKLSPRNIKPYETIKRVGPIVYDLALPSGLQKIHDVFHVFMLQRYRSNLSHFISEEAIEIQYDRYYENELVKY